MLKRVRLYNMTTNGRLVMPTFTTTSDNPGNIRDCWDISDNNAHTRITYFENDDGTDLALTAEPTAVSNKGNHFPFPLRFEKLGYNGGAVTGSAIECLVSIVDEATGQIVWPRQDTPIQLLPDNDWSRGCGYVYFALASDPDMPGWSPGIQYNYTLTIRNEGELPDSPWRSAQIAGTSARHNSLQVSAQPY